MVIEVNCQVEGTLPAKVTVLPGVDLGTSETATDLEEQKLQRNNNLTTVNRLAYFITLDRG